MKDGCGQSGVSAPFLKYLNEIAGRTGAARGNDRDRDGIGNRLRQLAIEAGLGAVAVHRGEQDFSRAVGRGFARPGQGIATGGRSTSGNEYLEAAIDPTGVDGYDHGLRAKTRGDGAD